MIKIAISQRIIPHYRIPVFKELGKRKDIDLTVFYGKGFNSGSQANAEHIEGFRHKRLFTIFLNFKRRKSPHLRVFHPALFFYLIIGKFDVVIVEPTTNFYNNIFTFIYCKLFKKKFIWYEAGTLPINERTKFRKLIDPIINIFIKNADSFITYTSYADYSLKKFYAIPKEKIFRAQNTIDTNKILEEIKKNSSLVDDKKIELNLTNNKVVMYIGGIEKRKKIELLISAVNILNNKYGNYRALIVGDGNDLSWLKSSISKEERDITIFAGKQIDESTLYVLCSDVVVLPAQGGLSIPQAFVCGKPFIGSEDIEYGGVKDYIKNGYNGFLIKENSINDLVEKLYITLSYKKKYAELSKNAFNSSKNLSIPKMVDGIEKAIQYSMDV